MLSWRRLDSLLPVAMAALFLLSLAVTFHQYRALEALEKRLNEIQRHRVAVPVGKRSLSVETVFSFPPTPQCSPQPSGVQAATLGHASKAGDPLLETLRDQLHGGLLLSFALLFGLILGVALSRRAAARERRLAEMKSAFVSNVSHEMKTPVSVIQMYAEMMELGRVRDPEKLRDYCRAIQKESQRLSRFMEDILECAKLESGKREFSFSRVDLCEVVERAVEEFEPAALSAGCELQLESSGPLFARADAKALSQVLHNLLSNALKYSADVKEIRVVVRKQGGQAAISVADRGIGIPEPEQRRIFEKFHRAESELTHNTKGTGLGLAIADHIVRAHQGRIAVASKPGEGSCFTIFLPLVEPSSRFTGSTAVSPAHDTEIVDHRR
ncbi:MAG: HAMP domain-containing histidine kinase [Bryobacteraceae bacterium]|nr:HAMP domain-containing histidine kinase [Bryobacteraceae bacterium]MDW8377276.1 HAMP domain-containing sensor histidine kinase [Bryobacterales bacterium]